MEKPKNKKVYIHFLIFILNVIFNYYKKSTGLFTFKKTLF